MLKDYSSHNRQLLDFERKVLPKKYKIFAGIDEAGRGPLAGPVVASAVILKRKEFKLKIFDSKQLTYQARQQAFAEIKANAYLGVGIVGSQVIDQKNILQATIMAMQEALDHLDCKPQYLLIDGRFKKNLFSYPYQSIISGDSRCFSIACASIVAKVIRDSLMSYYSALYPEYSFQRNRGYCTKEHLRAIEQFGLSPIHRRSFRPKALRDHLIYCGQ